MVEWRGGSSSCGNQLRQTKEHAVVGTVECSVAAWSLQKVCLEIAAQLHAHPGFSNNKLSEMKKASFSRLSLLEIPSWYMLPLEAMLVFMVPFVA